MSCNTVIEGRMEDGEGWRDGGREGWKEGWREGGMEGWRDGGREEGIKGSGRINLICGSPR